MFLFKKMIGPIFMPVSVCMGFLLIGLLLIWFGKRPKAGKIIVTIGLVLLIGFSYGGLPAALITQLEYRYPPFQIVNHEDDIKWVVVLGGGLTADPRLPANSQLNGATLARVVEGIRIHRLLPDSKMVLSGGSPFGIKSNAEGMADTALMLGVDHNDIVLESISKDTKDEAVLVKEIVQEDRFILVTSANHMPRSMALFQKLMMEPIPAPAEYFVKEGEGGVSWGMLFPSGGNLVNAEKAIYEYMGLAWAWIRRQT